MDEQHIRHRGYMITVCESRFDSLRGEIESSQRQLLESKQLSNGLTNKLYEVRKI